MSTERIVPVIVPVLVDADALTSPGASVAGVSLLLLFCESAGGVSLGAG
jgi:hypothetical protein